MNPRSHLAAALAIALGIHGALFFLLPEMMPNEKKRDLFTKDSVEITMAAVKAQKNDNAFPTKPPASKKTEAPSAEDPPAPQPPEQKRKLPNARRSAAPQPDPITAPDLKPVAPRPVPREKLPVPEQTAVSAPEPPEPPDPIDTPPSAPQPFPGIEPPPDSLKPKAAGQPPGTSAPGRSDPRENPQPDNKGKKTQSPLSGQKEITRAIPLYRSNPLPPYPANARRRGFEGTVELMVRVSKKGTVSEIEIETSSGHRSLDRQACKTVKQWEFEPGKTSGTPRAMWVKIPVTFKLQ
ncbi:MAG: TonB family protein [Desulfobacteraceae bacterium]